MKYSIYPFTELRSIPSEAQKIHLVRPIKLNKLKDLLEKRIIKEISLSDSCFKRLSEKARKLLQDKNVNVVKDNRSGRAIEIAMEDIVKINEFRKDFQSLRKIQNLMGIPKSTIHYLEKYAKGDKIRKGNQTIYLE